MSKKKKKDKDKGEAAAGDPVVATGISISAHPRARVSIRRARTRAALIAFALVLAMGLRGGQPAFDATWRALIAGIVVNVVVWRCAIIVWRHIVISELRAAEDDYDARRREVSEQIAARAAAKTESVSFRAA